MRSCDITGITFSRTTSLPGCDRRTLATQPCERWAGSSNGKRSAVTPAASHFLTAFARIRHTHGAEQIARIQTTSELFRVFGVAPVLGREFTEEETRPGSHNVVILGHGFWHRWFGGDHGVLGRSLAVSDGSLTIRAYCSWAIACKTDGRIVLGRMRCEGLLSLYGRRFRTTAVRIPDRSGGGASPIP